MELFQWVLCLWKTIFFMTGNNYFHWFIGDNVCIWGFFGQKLKNVTALIADLLKKKGKYIFEQNNVFFQPANKREYKIPFIASPFLKQTVFPEPTGASQTARLDFLFIY